MNILSRSKISEAWSQINTDDQKCYYMFPLWYLVGTEQDVTPGDLSKFVDGVYSLECF